jgi:hypothetical protein
VFDLNIREDITIVMADIRLNTFSASVKSLLARFSYQPLPLVACNIIASLNIFSVVIVLSY